MKKWALVIAALGITAGVAIAAVELFAPRSSARPPEPWAFETTYLFLSQDEMIAQADAIFVGTVVGFSPTRWNRDSGEYYPCEPLGNCPLPLHYVEVQVIRTIVDTLGLGETTTLTVLGASPLDAASSDDVEHDLQVGDRAIMFVRQGELAWRGGGTRPAIMFMTAPNISYLKYGDDGLYHYEGPEPADYTFEELVARIEGKRLVVPQPDQ